MQTRILTRFTALAVFVFTCFLTVDVIASDHELAPLLSPDAWKLLSEVEAHQQGLIPAKVKKLELKPRQPQYKRALIKRPNSRVMVKFSDNLEIRLNAQSKPYSRTMRNATTVIDLCENLEITLSPTLSQSHEQVDALIRKAELISHRQQPDIGGIYWINGDSSSVDVAAEMFSIMDEVEWVFYKPVISQMERKAPLPKAETKQNFVQQPMELAPIMNTGACQVSRNDCILGMTRTACLTRGGVFLGEGSVCETDNKLGSNSNSLGQLRGIGATGACCVLDACTAGSAAECTALGGVYQGDGTDCVENPCTGACCTDNGATCTDIISPDIPATDCAAAGGWYLGDGSTCAVDICPVGIGECCLPSGCTPVLDDAQCYGINGVYLGENEDEPPDPCGDSQTDCPPGGPDPETYYVCAEFGEYISYLAGDCYIDQSATLQTDRSPSPGCVDTELSLLPYNPLSIISPDINGDYVVASGAITNVATNVFNASTCCETIATNVPDCDPDEGNVWGPICASYANAYSVEGTNVCLRTSSPVDPNSPSYGDAPFGPVHTPRRVQPQFNMENIGSAVTVLRSTAGTGTASVEVVSVDPANPIGAQNLNLYEDGILVVTILLDDTTPIGPQDDPASIAGIINALPEWTGDVASEVSADTTADTLAILPLTSCLDTTVYVYAHPIGGGNFSPAGPSQYPKTSTTPDYAMMGLLASMSAEQIPYAARLLAGIPANPNPLPTGALTPWDPATEAVNFTYLNQTLPWPMGGAVIGTANYPAPLTTEGPAAGTAGWFGGEGINLFPDAENPDGFGDQDQYKGAYGYGNYWQDEESVGTNGSFGAGVKIAVLDWSAHLQEQTNETGVRIGGIHEEFLAADNTTLRIILESEANTGHEDLSLVFDENLNQGNLWMYSADHGSAVLGVIAARWNPDAVPGDSLETRLQNNVGVLGLAPDAEVYFFPLTSEEAPDREQQAWYNAIETLDAGDVIAAGYQPVAVDATRPNLNYWEDTAAYIEIANNLSICTVIKAGDRGLDLSGLELPNGDQNVIVATAVTPGLPYKRWANNERASNYATALDEYSQVAVSGWGMGVTTCGKGLIRDNYLGYSTITYENEDDGAGGVIKGPTDAHIVHRQAYTNNFGFTDAAAAQAAGCAAILQGFTKQIFGVPMGPEICRQLLAGGQYEGRDKEGNNILVPVELDQKTTEVGLDNECQEDASPDLNWDWCGVPGFGNATGDLLDPREAMVRAIYNPIFDTPNISTVMFVRGTQLFGNQYSIAATDGNLLAGNPVATSAHDEYALPAGVPGGSVRYNSNRHITDLYVSGELISGLPLSNTLNVSVTLFDVQQPWLVMGVEFFDNITRRWRRAAGSTTLTAGDTEVDFTIENAWRYVNSASNAYHMRIITRNWSGPLTPTFPVYYEQISVTSGAIQQN